MDDCNTLRDGIRNECICRKLEISSVQEKMRENGLGMFNKYK